MRKALLLTTALIGFAPSVAQAQSGCPYLAFGNVLTAAQWQLCFSNKQDSLSYTPVNKAGDFMLGELTTAAPTTATSGFNLPHGSAPTSPVNGDTWTTSAGLFARINGVTIGPMAPFGGSAGGSPGQIQYNNSGSFGGYTIGTGLGVSAGSLILSTPVATSNGGTGVNNPYSITLSGVISTGGALTTGGVLTTSNNFTTTGAFPMTLNALASVNFTLPNGTATAAALNLVDQILTGGFNATTLSNGTATGTFTPDCGNRGVQAIVGAAAPWTIAAPANDTPGCILLLTNPGSSVNIPTFSGYSEGTNTGDALTATTTANFSIFIWRVNGISGYRVAAHQ